MKVLLILIGMVLAACAPQPARPSGQSAPEEPGAPPPPLASRTTCTDAKVYSETQESDAAFLYVIPKANDVFVYEIRPDGWVLILRHAETGAEQWIRLDTLCPQ